MNEYVVDASVALKWYFVEDYTEEAARLLGDSVVLHAPDYLLVEFDNALYKRYRRSSISEIEAKKIRNGLRLTPIEYYPVSFIHDSAWNIAFEVRHSLYDCLYLALARVLRIRFATADQQLLNALAGGPYEKYALWIADVPEPA